MKWSDFEVKESKFRVAVGQISTSRILKMCIQRSGWQTSSTKEAYRWTFCRHKPSSFTYVFGKYEYV